MRGHALIAGLGYEPTRPGALGTVFKDRPGPFACFVCDGDNTDGGRVVTKPSGGLFGQGHPLGAPGLAQCTKILHRLRGTAGARQAPDARLGLQHKPGLGGACVVTLYEEM